MTQLTPEITEKLSAPVPANQIKQLGDRGIRYTTDKWVQNRLDEAVGASNWIVGYTTVAYGQPVQAMVNKRGDTKLLLGTLTCDLTIMGVTKSAVVDLELPNEVMRGTPGTNAQAKAFKRAAMLFGVARELWPEAVEDEYSSAPASAQPQRPRPANAVPAPASTRKPPISEKQVQLLRDMHVSDALIVQLEGSDVRSVDFGGKDLIGVLKKKRPDTQDAAATIVYAVTGKYVEDQNSGDDLLGDDEEE